MDQKVNIPFSMQEFHFFLRYKEGKRKEVSRMLANWRRALSWLCALALCFSCAGALAEFSPRLSEMAQSDNTTAKISFQLESLAPLGASSLQIINDWLGKAEFVVSQGKDARSEILVDGERAFAAYTRRQQGLTLTTFLPSGTSYLTDDKKGDMLSALTGTGMEIPDFSRFPDAYAAVADSLYDFLQGIVEPKLVKERTSIKYAAASAAYENYPLTADQMNEAWPGLLEVILPALRETLDGQALLYAKAEETLRALTFSGECRFKRFLDKENGDMGMQFTGVAEKNGDKRKVTLFGGYTPGKGGYISISLPAASGKGNNLKITLAAQLTNKNDIRTLTLEGAYVRKLGDQNAEAELEGTLKNKMADESESWSGKLTLTQTENKVKNVWTLQPELMFQDDGLSGTVRIQRKTGGKVTLKGEAKVLLTTSEAWEFPQVRSAKNLKDESADRIRQAALEEVSPLAELISQLFSGLSETERTQLLHDLRTDEWMNGGM